MNPLRYDWQLSLEHPVFAQYSHHDPGESKCIADMHSAVHLGVLIQGDTTISYNGEIVKVTEGNLYLTSPYEQHKSIYSENGNFLLLISFCQEALDNTMLSLSSKIKSLFRFSPSKRQDILNTLKINQNYSLLKERKKSPNGIFFLTLSCISS